MIWLIGYGNPGRGDDGLGPALAARFMDVPGLKVAIDYQLTVDHALQIANAETVIFADALMGSEGPFHFAKVTPSTAHDVTSHSLSPEAVLALCGTLFGRVPEAFVLGVAGSAFGAVKEGLSDAAQQNLTLAEAHLRGWLAQDASAGGFAHA